MTSKYDHVEMPTTYEIRGSYYVPNERGFASAQEAVDSVIARLTSIGQSPVMQEISGDVYVWASDEDRLADDTAADAAAVICATAAW